MRLRSTGLGRTEVEGKVIKVKRVDEVIIFFVDIIKPVRWHTRMAFQERDLRRLIFSMLKPKNLMFIIRAFLCDQDKVSRTEAF